MLTRAELIANYWVENKNKILSVAICAKLFGGGNCSSNRSKIKPHILKAKEMVEEDRGEYIYEIRQGKRVLGYKVVTTPEEQKLYEIDLESRKRKSDKTEKKFLIGHKNLTQKNFPMSDSVKQLPNNIMV